MIDAPPRPTWMWCMASPLCPGLLARGFSSPVPALCWRSDRRVCRSSGWTALGNRQPAASRRMPWPAPDSGQRLWRRAHRGTNLRRSAVTPVFGAASCCGVAAIAAMRLCTGDASRSSYGLAVRLPTQGVRRKIWLCGKQPVLKHFALLADRLREVQQPAPATPGQGLPSHWANHALPLRTRPSRCNSSSCACSRRCCRMLVLPPLRVAQRIQHFAFLPLLLEPRPSAPPRQFVILAVDVATAFAGRRWHRRRAILK